MVIYSVTDSLGKEYRYIYSDRYGYRLERNGKEYDTVYESLDSTNEYNEVPTQWYLDEIAEKISEDNTEE